MDADPMYPATTAGSAKMPAPTVRLTALAANPRIPITLLRPSSDGDVKFFYCNVTKGNILSRRSRELQSKIRVADISNCQEVYNRIYSLIKGKNAAPCLHRKQSIEKAHSHPSTKIGREP
jgi:hypothetical protein